LRKLADLYVRQEFHEHHANPNPEYYQKFYNEWAMYSEQLSKEGLMGVAKPIDEKT
jgi:hypothetical protein